MEFLSEFKRTPIIAETDIIVVGGGPAGISAAITAARMGTKITLIERYGWLGGQATGGLVVALIGATYGQETIVRGLYQELVKLLENMDGVKRMPYPSGIKEMPYPCVHPETLKYLLDLYVREEDINLYLHTFAVGAMVENNKVQTIIIESKSGRAAIRGQVVVDATGDGDLAEWCRIPYEKATKGQRMCTTLVYRLGNVDWTKARRFEEECPEERISIIQVAKEKFGLELNWSPTLNPGEILGEEASMDIDALNVKDLTWAGMEGRRKVTKALEFYHGHYPGFENAFLIDTAPQLGVRETRRIQGQYILTRKDFEEGKTFEDSIARIGNPILGPGHTLGLPFRCLLPQRITNLIVAGRCISVTHDVLDYVRAIPYCIAQGEAAGIAASLALNRQGEFNEVNVQDLQKLLVKNGTII